VRLGRPLATIRTVGALQDSEAERIGRARRYTVAGAVRDLAGIGARLPGVWRVWGRGEVDPKLREQVMLAVAQANACRYCTFAHTQWALAVGVDECELPGLPGADSERLDPDARAAIAWALAWLEAERGPVDAGLEAELRSRHDARWRRDLETVVRVMTLANLSANTFEALASRLRGAPVAGSRLGDEVVVGGCVAASLAPVLLLLSALRGQAPHRLAREFRSTAAAAG